VSQHSKHLKKGKSGRKQLGNGPPSQDITREKTGGRASHAKRAEGNKGVAGTDTRGKKKAWGAQPGKRQTAKNTQGNKKGNSRNQYPGEKWKPEINTKKKGGKETKGQTKEG